MKLFQFEHYHNPEDESTIIGIPIVIKEWFTKIPFDKISSTRYIRFAKLTHLGKSQFGW